MQAATAVANHSELRERVLAYLDDHTVLSLATSGPAGLWAAPIMYVNEGTTFYFTSVASTRHGVNMEATHRVVGTINDECREWIDMKGLQIEGTVERVTDVGERRRAIAAYLRRFPFGAGLWNGETNPDVIARDPGIHNFYRISPTKLLFTDNEHAPGGREELPVE
jgi:uncharacterized protein YhbP (UPF0306 family)